MQYLFALFLSFSLFAEIVEFPYFRELSSYLDEETLLILDIDDTLLIPVQMLGCDEWFKHRLKQHQDAGFSAQTALEKALGEWEAIRHLTKMEIVEPGTDAEILRLQKSGRPVMGLTTQGLALATRTSLQLQENQIDLSLTAPTPHDHFFQIDGHGVLFRNGILFTSGKHKGKALLELLHQIDVPYRRIVFVNDKKTHLAEVEEVLCQHNFAFVGLRYSYSDARKQAFCPELAHYQFTHSTLDHLLSDTEASEKSPKKLY